MKYFYFIFYAFLLIFNVCLTFVFFKADENDCEPVDDFVLMKTAHTNKHTGEIDDGVVRDVISLIETQKEDEETRLSQLQTDLDATSTASTNLSRIRINEIVESVSSFFF